MEAGNFGSVQVCEGDSSEEENFICSDDERRLVTGRVNSPRWCRRWDLLKFTRYKVVAIEVVDDNNMFLLRKVMLYI
jgi:hypothetical protein